MTLVIYMYLHNCNVIGKIQTCYLWFLLVTKSHVLLDDTVAWLHFLSKFLFKENINFQLKCKETEYVIIFFHLKSEITSIIFLDHIWITIAVDSETILLHLSSDIINLSEPEAYILMGIRSPGSFIFIFSKIQLLVPTLPNTVISTVL